MSLSLIFGNSVFLPSLLKKYLQAANSRAGIIQLIQSLIGEDEHLLSIVHDGLEVIRKAQSVAIFDVEVLFFIFKQKKKKTSSNQTFMKV